MSIKDNVTGFQHLGVPAADLEKSIAFYCGFGFSVESRYQFPENGGTTKVAFLKLGSFCLELYQGVLHEKGRSVGPVDHFTLDVKDIDAAFAELKAAGYPICEAAPVQLPLQKNGIKYFIVMGPDGERLEFNQILS